jgi:hypothetical protein
MSFPFSLRGKLNLSAIGVGQEERSSRQRPHSACTGRTSGEGTAEALGSGMTYPFNAPDDLPLILGNTPVPEMREVLFVVAYDVPADLER